MRITWYLSKLVCCTRPLSTVISPHSAARQAEDDARLDLRLHRVGVDHAAEVGRDGHLVHDRRAVLDRDLGHLRHVGVVAFHQRDAAEAPGRRRRAPAGLVGGELEHVGEARLACRAATCGRRTGPCLRPPASSSMKLSLAKAFSAVADRAPVADAQAGVVLDHVVRGSPGSRRRRPPPRSSAGPARRAAGRRRAPVTDCDVKRKVIAVGLPSAPSAAAMLVHRLRPIEVVRHVVFARPQQLDRLADGLARSAPPG